MVAAPRNDPDGDCCRFDLDTLSLSAATWIGLLDRPVAADGRVVQEPGLQTGVQRE